MSSRAVPGGEVAVNGEFYKGGTFLPATTRPKGISKSRRSCRRALISPGVMQTMPEGLASIYQRIQHFVRPVEGKLQAVFADDHPSMTYYFHGAEHLHKLIADYNMGVRYFISDPSCFSELIE